MNIKIAMTIGDAGGVGPEISVKSALDSDLRMICLPVLVGPESVIQRAIDTHAPGTPLLGYSEQIDIVDGTIYFDDFGSLKAENYTDNKSCAVSGLAAYNGVVEATKAVLSGKYDAIVTAPVSKESVNLAGIQFQGHTELVAELSGTEDFAMMQSDGPLRVNFVTCHIPLKDVSEAISKERILKCIELINEAAIADGVTQPKIAIAGVNPHAGEGGYMGREEIETVIPAMDLAREQKIDVHGPFPADTLFIESIRTKFDGIVCMYHDQGHIPFKMLAFDRGVNSTLGLPIIRTSVDHGTAFDIAWQGKADTGSLLAAAKTAVNRARLKKALSES
ncbi:MAG: 4-hydroxythreonine-4-phosphate dehydrogenase PdxA [Lentisphaeraceae bacterium]|nr:4-hydroxythreonine-4-phosphate dehydrogenase PdxA [Lentisphaeraceae bacterium]